MVRTTLYGLFRNDAWHASLSARMGQDVRGNGWAMQENTGYSNPESSLEECQRQTEALIGELPRLINTSMKLLEQMAAEGREVGEYDLPPTAGQVIASYKASTEARRLDRMAQQKVIKAGIPSIFAMLSP
jgi:hypothetical protein